MEPAMQNSQSLPELFFEFHGLCQCPAPFESLLLHRLNATNKPPEDLTLREVRNIVLTAQGEYDNAAESEQTDWPEICIAAKESLEQAA
jgi:hypothetical protein